MSKLLLFIALAVASTQAVDFQCITGATQLANEIRNMTSTLQNVTDIQETVEELAKVLNMTLNTAPHCGINVTGISDVVVPYINNTNNTACINDLEELGHFAYNIFVDFEHRNFTSLVDDVIYFY